MIRIRPAVAADVPCLYQMLHHLAQWEGGQISATEQDMLRDGFGPQPKFHALLAEDQAGQGVGCLTYFPIYSSWRGCTGLMIHDLFVYPSARGHGIGRALVTEVQHSMRQTMIDGGRLDVCVLTWNTKAQSFYHSLGLSPQSDWVIYRQDF